MKKLLLWSVLAAFVTLVSGCTNTVNGIQEDSSEAWHGTKRVIHEATAED